MKKIQNINSLYIHFPFCKQICNYCDFYRNIYSDDAVLRYERHLKEVDFLEFSPLETLYIGGGTPSLWTPLNFDYHFATNYEFTLEANPATLSNLKFWKDKGLNRLSIGVQAFDDRFLKILGRIHNVEDIKNLLKKVDLNFSCDFMLGLPFSEEYKRDIISELREVLKYSPNHLSVYILTVGDNYIHYKNLPSEDYIFDEYLKVSKFLIDEGYDHYEVSNFARDGKYSQHNLRYWKSESVAALGPSATGFDRDNLLRYKWAKDYKLEFENLTKEEFSFEEKYLKLRTNLGLDIEHNIPEKFLASKRPLKLNSYGYLMMDTIFLDYIK